MSVASSNIENQPPGEFEPAIFQYDAFLSYSTRADYNQARKVEAFLESFHRSFSPENVPIRQMQICRDGSDFKLPAKRENLSTADDPIWDIIVAELSKARYLIALCSPESAHSEWVSKEISWMMDHRGSASILPVVTKGDDPTENPAECFPPEIIAAGLHKARLWYDLRSWGTASVTGKVRDAEDELVRLAADLLGWDDTKNGQLAPLWFREQLKKRRRQTFLAIAIAAAFTVAAALVIWRSVVASREANRARANAIVLAADGSPDPLQAALLLSELLENDEPDDGTRVAQKLASTILPTALLRGHTGRLLRVSFNSNQTRVLTASVDGTARIWPTDGKGDPIILRGPASPSNYANFDSEGSLLAVASEDNSMRVWNDQGQQVSQIFAHDSPVVQVEFSSDKEWLATVTQAGSGTLWRIKGYEKSVLSLPNDHKVETVWLSAKGPDGLVAATNLTVWSFQYDAQANVNLKPLVEDKDVSGDQFNEVDFSPDGSHIAGRSNDKVVVRSLQNKTVIILKHDKSVGSIAFSSDGTQLVSSCSDGKLRLWNTDTGELKNTLDVVDHRLILDLSNAKPVRESISVSATSVRFSHDDLRVASLFDDGIVRLWNVGSDGGTTELKSVGPDVFAFSKDDTKLITGNDDGAARVWSLSAETEPIVVRHAKAIYAASMSEDGRLVASGSADGLTHLWQVSDPAKQIELKKVEGTIKGIAFNKSGARLATAQNSGTIELWDVTNWQLPVLKKEFREPGQSFAGVQFDSSGQKILAWSESGNTYLWSIEDSNENILQAENGSVWYAEFSPDGKRVVTAYDKGSVRIWDADGSGKYVSLGGNQAHAKAVFRAIFSPDGLRVLTVSEDGTARLWNSDGSGVPLVLAGANIAKDWTENCAFSPDGKKFVVTFSSGRAWIWPADGQGKPIVLRSIADLAHIASITSVSFSSDSKRIITAGGADGVVRIWQADGSGKPITLPGHEGTVTWAAFSHDGSRVISTSEDGSERVWRTSWRDLVQDLRSRTTASLTAEERMIYLGESETTARANYEAQEKNFNRTPLPANWQFAYRF